MDSIQDDFLNSVWVSVWDNVGHEVAACIQASVHDNVGLREGVRTSVFESVYGAHEARWLAFYRYLYEVTGLVDQTSKLSGLWELAHSAGWALPHENICWVSERHHILFAINGADCIVKLALPAHTPMDLQSMRFTACVCLNTSLSSRPKSPLNGLMPNPMLKFAA